MALAIATQVAVDVIFVDRGGNASQTRLHFRHGAAISAILSALDTLMPILADISDAQLGRVSITATWEPDTIAATSTTDIQASVALFYTNDTATAQERIDIPSPKGSLFETDGDYAGIRVLADEDMVLLLNGLVAFLCTYEGDEFPPIYDIGGLSQ